MIDPNDDPEVPDLGEYIEDAITLSSDPKKLIAVAAATLGLGGMTTAPVISTKQPIRKPDEHMASQSHEPETAL